MRQIVGSTTPTTGIWLRSPLGFIRLCEQTPYQSEPEHGLVIWSQCGKCPSRGGYIDLPKAMEVSPMMDLCRNNLIPCPRQTEFDLSDVARCKRKPADPIMDHTKTVNHEPNLLQPHKQNIGNGIRGEFKISMSHARNRGSPEIQVTSVAGHTTSPQKGNMLRISVGFYKSKQQVRVDAGLLVRKGSRGTASKFFPNIVAQWG
jgi:hypothetical protein